jgi:hypothetical protein
LRKYTKYRGDISLEPSRNKNIICPDPYDSEIRYFTLTEHKGNKTSVQTLTLHNEKLRDLYRLQSALIIVKERRLRMWAEIGEIKMPRLLVVKFLGKHPLGRPRKWEGNTSTVLMEIGCEAVK